MSAVDLRLAGLEEITSASRELAELERAVAEAQARRDALIREARRESRCTIAEIQTASSLSRPRVNQILAR